MENNHYDILNLIDYLEFRQNLLILKEPCHKASIFFYLDIDIYLEMRKLSNEFCKKIANGEKLTLQDYEKSIIDIWPSIKSYPSSYSLIAKSLLDKNSFNSLINNSF
ncbi:MAG: hypothetical protein ACI4PU_00865 [Intestinibacter sp.]